MRGNIHHKHYPPVAIPENETWQANKAKYHKYHS